jgi:hypothetical protein
VCDDSEPPLPGTMTTRRLGIDGSDTVIAESEHGGVAAISISG